MQHHFNTEIAKKYDIVTAVILDNLFYWTEKNRANKKHFIDGRYWTYNSKVAMSELFPYLTPRQIDYATKKMQENGLILIANHSENKYDRTLWYAITDFGYSILQNCEMYNNIYNTNTNTNTKKEIKKESCKNEKRVEDVDISRWFDNVWSIYPKKIDKVQAKKTFEHKLRGLPYDYGHKKAVFIYRMLQEQVGIWKNNNTENKYIKNCSSWLNANIEDSEKYKKKK